MEKYENARQVLMSLFDKKDIDPAYEKKVNTDAIIEEYNLAMKQCRKESEALEKQRRLEVINTLTKEEKALVIDLYMQDLLSMYEKKSNSKVDIIVRS